MANAIDVGVQLWTLRREAEIDLAGTLERVAAMGYEGVELWFPSYPGAAEVKSLTDSLGLRTTSAHVPFLDLRDRTDEVMEYHNTLGNRRLVIPYISPEMRRDSTQWKRRIEEISEIARRTAREGFELFYHHHDMELKESVNGVTVHQHIFPSVDRTQRRRAGQCGSRRRRDRLGIGR